MTAPRIPHTIKKTNAALAIWRISSSLKEFGQALQEAACIVANPSNYSQEELESSSTTLKELQQQCDSFSKQLVESVKELAPGPSLGYVHRRQKERTIRKDMSNKLHSFPANAPAPSVPLQEEANMQPSPQAPVHKTTNNALPQLAPTQTLQNATDDQHSPAPSLQNGKDNLSEQNPLPQPMGALRDKGLPTETLRDKTNVRPVPTAPEAENSTDLPQNQAPTLQPTSIKQKDKGAPEETLQDATTKRPSSTSTARPSKKQKTASPTQTTIELPKPKSGEYYSKAELVELITTKTAIGSKERTAIINQIVEQKLVPCQKSHIHKLMRKHENEGLSLEVLDKAWGIVGRPALDSIFAITKPPKPYKKRTVVPKPTPTIDFVLPQPKSGPHYSKAELVELIVTKTEHGSKDRTRLLDTISKKELVPCSRRHMVKLLAKHEKGGVSLKELDKPWGLFGRTPLLDTQEVTNLISKLETISGKSLTKESIEAAIIDHRRSRMIEQGKAPDASTNPSKASVRNYQALVVAELASRRDTNQSRLRS